MPLQVDVVSAERQLFSGEVAELYARSVEGEIGILPGHEPILIALAAAPLRLKTKDGGTTAVAIHRGGFLECSDDHVNVLCDVAEVSDEIDVQRAERALERARQHLENPAYEGDAAAELRRAQLRLRVATGQHEAEH